MVIEVHVAALQPHGVMQPPRDVDQFVAQRLQQGQPAADMVAKRLEPEPGDVGRMEDRHLQCVRVQTHGRMHSIDVRDAAAAFPAASTADVVGEILLIGGDETHLLR